MPYDQDRYRSLIARAAFDMSAYKGTFQDLSPAQRTMTAVGAPKWGRINGVPCLKQNASGEGCTSGNVASVVDVTGAFTVEAVLVPRLAGVNYVSAQLGPGGVGGFRFIWWEGFPYSCSVHLRDNAGALARSLVLPVNAAPANGLRHVLINSRTGGTTGAGWLNGTPVVVAFGGAGVPVNCVPSPVQVGGAGAAGQLDCLLSRIIPSSITNEDAACLYGAARVLTGGDV